MITLNSVLFSTIAGLVIFKVIIMAAAAVIALYSFTAQVRQHTVAPARARNSARDRGLDIYV
jgi:hypothetical protein